MTRRNEPWNKPDEWKAFRDPEPPVWKCTNCAEELPSMGLAFVHLMLENRRVEAPVILTVLRRLE